MNKKRAVAGLLGFAVVLLLLFAWRVFRDRGSAPEVASPQSTTVHLGWIFSGAYAGEALAAKQFGPEIGLSIRLSEGGPGLDPLRQIRDGEFGVAASEEVIRAIALGAPVKIIAVLNDESPAAFAVREGQGILGAADFPGKRVGVLPFGSTGLVYQSLLERAQIARSSVVEVPTSPDLRPFILGNYDVHPIYAYDEPVTLDSLGMNYFVLKPSEYGVDFKGPVYFTTIPTLRDSTLLTKFIAATARGWAAAIQNPDSAIAALSAIDPDINERRERAVLERALPYYGSADRDPLTSDESSWGQMIRTLVDLDVIAAPLPVDSVLDLSFVRAYYRARNDDGRGN